MDKEKSTTFIFPSGFTLGGVTSWSIEMLNQLDKRGVPTNLIKYRNIGKEIPLNYPDSSQLIRCDGPQLPIKKELEQFADEYKRALPGIVIPNYNHRTFAICTKILEVEKDGLRVIGYAHTDETSYYAFLWYYESIIHRFVAVSEEIGAKLQRLLPHRQKDIVVRPYAVHASPHLERTYSEKAEPLQITYAGRISTVQKRILDLIPLVQNLSELGINFQLNIVGDGSEKQALIDGVGNFPEEVQAKISLRDAVAPADMPELWKHADICILVSAYEGTSISLLEAMAQGCVPVVTQVSGVEGVLRNGENGFFVPVGDMQKMAQVIQQIDQDRNLLKRAGTEAHRTITSRYNYDDYVDWFVQMSEDIWLEPAKQWGRNTPSYVNWKMMQNFQSLISQLID